MSTLPILELGERCDDLAADADHVFAVLGAWVGDTERAAERQFFAAACHRHAWHAELWRARRPDIPGPSARRRHDVTLDATAPDRAAAYLDVLDRLRRSLDELRAATDALLDPGTVRVVDLVDRDLTDLAARLDRATG